jgi:hypothetical protein
MKNQVSKDLWIFIFALAVAPFYTITMILGNNLERIATSLEVIAKNMEESKK